jgi:hypothetical protein
MAGYEFNSETLHFYENEHTGYPDEVDITIIHKDFTEKNKSTIRNGIYIFLDNYLGELDFAVNIDNLEIIEPGNTEKELIPIVLAIV